MMPLSASKLRSARRYRLVHDWALTEEEATQFIARFPVQHASRRQLQTDVQAVIAARMQPAADGDLEPEFIRMTLQPDWPKVKTERVDDDASPAVPRAMPSFPPPPMPPKDVLLKGRVESAREKTVRMARERSASSPSSSAAQAEPVLGLLGMARNARRMHGGGGSKLGHAPGWGVFLVWSVRALGWGMVGCGAVGSGVGQVGCVRVGFIVHPALCPLPLLSSAYHVCHRVTRDGS